MANLHNLKNAQGFQRTRLIATATYDHVEGGEPGTVQIICSFYYDPLQT